MNQLGLPDEAIVDRIYLVRGQKVMIDKDLAQMYGITTGNLNKAVKRNIRRFPDDFMFQLKTEEVSGFQIGILNAKRGQNIKYLPYAFTEQGVVMLSSVLNKNIAIEVNIRIIRIFTRLREMLLTHKDILLKLEQLERQVTQNSAEIQIIFAALKELLNPPNPPREPIGFKTGKSRKP